MFHAEKLPVAAHSAADVQPPREIHIWVDRANHLLRIDPPGTVESAAADEIFASLKKNPNWMDSGLPLQGNVIETVLVAAEICSKYGWVGGEPWYDAATRSLHVKMTKPAKG